MNKPFWYWCFGCERMKSCKRVREMQPSPDGQRVHTILCNGCRKNARRQSKQ